MNIAAHSKNVRISTRKVRIVADAIRTLSVDQALAALKLSDRRAAGPLEDTLKSAVANAVNNANVSRDNLVISSVIVNEGQAMKRYHPSTRGRVHPYKRRASHITITLAEKENVKKVVKARDTKKGEEKEKIKDKK